MSVKSKGEQHAADLLQQYGALPRTDDTMHSLLAMAYSQGFIDGATVSADVTRKVFEAVGAEGKTANTEVAQA